MLVVTAVAGVIFVFSLVLLLLLVVVFFPVEDAVVVVVADADFVLAFAFDFFLDVVIR